MFVTRFVGSASIYVYKQIYIYMYTFVYAPIVTSTECVRESERAERALSGDKLTYQSHSAFDRKLL